MNNIYIILKIFKITNRKFDNIQAICKVVTMNSMWGRARNGVHKNQASGHSWTNRDKFINCWEINKFLSDLHENLSPDRFWPQDFDFWGPEGQFWKTNCQNYKKELKKIKNWMASNILLFFDPPHRFICVHMHTYIYLCQGGVQATWGGESGVITSWPAHSSRVVYE